MASVLSVQSSDQKGNQQPRRNRKKGKNNRKGGNMNENANNNDKNARNAGGDKQAKRKVKFPCKLCKEDHLTYLCPRIDEALRLLAQGLAVLTNPLPHNQNMNSRNHDQFGGDQDLSEGSGHGCINMLCAVKVVTRAKDYGLSQPTLGKEPDPPGTPLHIEKPVDKPEAVPRIPKGVLKHSGHNPNAQASQNYSVVEDLGHTACAMSLEVLQSCPSQRKALLSALGVNDDNSSLVIKFQTAGLQPHFPYYMYLLIHVECLNMTVKHTVIDEGVAASVMSLSCWKGLGSPELSKSATMLTTFDGRSFRLHGILPSFKVHLG